MFDVLNLYGQSDVMARVRDWTLKGSDNDRW